jgi:hypothetical protein
MLMVAEVLGRGVRGEIWHGKTRADQAVDPREEGYCEAIQSSDGGVAKPTTCHDAIDLNARYDRWKECERPPQPKCVMRDLEQETWTKQVY